MSVKFLEKLRSFFRIFDLCSVSFSFKYMDENKYTTSIGGVVSICFFIIGSVIFVLNFIPFYKDQNFTLQDYIVNTDKTEEIKLNESPMALAIGFDCPADSKTQIKGEDLFDLNVSFITYTKDDKGNRNKSIENIETHLCITNDFHNEHNDSFKLLNIDKLYCLDKKGEKKNTKLEGIYTDEKFTYYEFSLIAKKDTAEHYKKINDYLIENDCKLQFYYTDLTLNLSNYKKPIKSYINSLFLQINPTLFLKMNVFFMNYHLNDNKVLVPIINKEEEPLLKTGFSRAEQYFLYKGTDRFSNKPYNYNKYANLYIRVDNKKLEIKRKYQNILEFYADNSVLLISLFVFINFIIRIYNTFKSNLSISRRLFFNEEEQKYKIIKLIFKKDGEEKYSKNSISNSNHKEINDKDNYCNTQDKKSFRYEKKQKTSKNNRLPYICSFSSIYYCCYTKKKNWYKKAKKILDNRLDIFFYIRKMILLELIIGKYFVDKNQKEINFKSRTFEYIDNNESKNLQCYYKWSKELDLSNFLKDFEKTEDRSTENASTEHEMGNSKEEFKSKQY